MYSAATLLMLIAMGLALVRALQGPTVFDRILAVNMFGSATVVMISVVGFMIGRADLIDIAIIYALISFTGTIAVLRFVEYERECGEVEGSTIQSTTSYPPAASPKAGLGLDHWTSNPGGVPREER